MQQPTLVILAAGMASRFGSMKQIESFGPSGETIMEYSIYDAIHAGFKKVVFIIREEFAENFKNIFEPKLRGKITTEYVFQQLDYFTGDCVIPFERKKPWGTAHAVLCCKNIVKEPFAIINADDFYGRDAYIKAYDFLTKKCTDTLYASIAYKLKNTLSENGSVSRGVITTDANGKMTSITERTKIYYKDNQIVFEEEGIEEKLDPSATVSMNFFCFGANFINLCERSFSEFLDKNIQNPKSEFLMPLMADKFIKDGLGAIDTIITDAKWFGVTYKEDTLTTKTNIATLITQGIYVESLWK